MSSKMVQMTFFDHDDAEKINSRFEHIENEVSNCRKGLFARYARLELEMYQMQKVMDKLMFK
jgi:tetrahydromethanopterin S-methyltransferase subunit G